MEILGGADGPTVIYLTGGILNNVAFAPAGVIALTVALCLAAYFIGNISPSTIMARKQGIDIKKEGSGNAGTTNALRVMGKKAAVVTLVIDILKGVVATLLGGLFMGPSGMACCALMVVVGHVWPAIYRFRGGKGVATMFGAVLAISPLIALIDLVIVAIVVFASKRMSPGSIVGGICLPILSWFLAPHFFLESIVMAIILIVKHRANIVRIIHGEEPKMSIFEKKKDSETGGAE